MKNIPAFILAALVRLVDNFKTKNPQMFLIVVGVLMAVYSALEYYTANDLLTDVEVNIFGLSFFVISTIKKALVLIMALTGAHTPQVRALVAQPATALAATPPPNKYDAWKGGQVYRKGQIISQYGKNFTPKIDHISNETNQPSLDHDQTFWELQ
jgi:hypothetical protein